MSVDFVRLTTLDGNVYYKRVNKDEKLLVPSEEAIRERLIQLLETAGGDVNDPSVIKFWNERSNAMINVDGMKAACARAIYERLTVEWDKLITPPSTENQTLNEIFADCPPAPEPDIFAAFGVTAPEQEKWVPEELTERENAALSKLKNVLRGSWIE